MRIFFQTKRIAQALESYPDLKPLSVIFTSALMLRLGYVFFLPQPPMVFDAARFLGTANALLTGDLTPMARETLEVWGPGYLVFLTGLLGLNSGDVWLVRLLQAGLGALTCVIVFKIALLVSDRRAAWGAALLAIVYPPLVLFTGRLLAETLSIFLLWLGMWLAISALPRTLARRLAFAGLVFGLAALTRPRFLPFLPFLVLAVLFASKAKWSRRMFYTACVAAPIFTLLVAWNLLQRQVGANPIVGSAGVSFVLADGWGMMSPTYKGWLPDYGTGTPSWFWKMMRQEPLYLLLSPLNLIFYHLWFAEDAWRELGTFKNALDFIQRGIVLLAFGGMGLGLARCRQYLLLYAVLCGFILTAPLKQIEVRHTLPILPVLFVFASAACVQIWDWAHATKRSQRIFLLCATVILTIVVVGLTETRVLFQLFVNFPAEFLGKLGDAAVVGVLLLWGILFSWVASAKLSRIPGLLMWSAPILFLALMYVAYSYIGSTLRWRAWQVDFNQGTVTATQTIQLDTPLRGADIEQAIWLVDLETDGAPPRLDIMLNGQWITPNGSGWETPFCGKAELENSDAVSLEPQDFFMLTGQGGSPLPVSTQRWFDEWCTNYRFIESFTRQPLISYPQWWAVNVSPDVLDNRDTISLSLRAASTAQRVMPQKILLGGTYAHAASSAYNGPSLLAFLPGVRTSFYRWHVTQDWRLWETAILASHFTTSTLETDDASLALVSLRERLARQEGVWNIRLVIRYKDGETIFY